MIDNAKVWLNMFESTMHHGQLAAPRGLEIYEIEDLQITLDPSNPFMNFKDRKYDVNYFKHEMIWKLGANKYDDSIKCKAKMWESTQNPDGTFNSNYGQYWFGEQQGFNSVIAELMRDKFSRRAVIPMLNHKHLSPHTKDSVCTECIGFRIRHSKLNMSVHMRSSDQIFGLGTDIPTFSFLYRLVYAVLKDLYEDLEIGTLCITAMSSHIYYRHFDMVMKILKNGVNEFTAIQMPWPNNSIESMYLAYSRGKHLSIGGVLGSWLGDIK